MCSRFTLGDEEHGCLTEEEKQLLKARSKRLGIEPRLTGEQRPTDFVPVLAPDAVRHAPGLYLMQWGFKHPGRDMLVINARSETAPEKDMFRESTFNRRCLLPAAGYFEWKKEADGKKTKYLFTPSAGRLCIAGLYVRATGMKLPACVILTRDAGEGIRGIHARMPVLLPEALAKDWLSEGSDYLALLAEALPDAVTAERAP